MSCPVNFDTIKNGIVSQVETQLDNSPLLEKEGDLYRIIDEDSDYQPLVEDINNQYQEELVMKMRMQPYLAVVDPSEELVNKYLESADEQRVPEYGDIIEYDGVQYEVKDSNRIGSQLLSGEQRLSLSEDGEDVEMYKTAALDSIPVYNLDPLGDYTVEFGGIDPIFNIPLTALVAKGYKIVGKSDRLQKLSEEFDDLWFSATSVEEESQTLSSKAGKITKNKVLQWLEAIGFTNIKTVSQLTYKGKPLSGRAYIDFANSVMQIVEGQEDYTLPEEAMTILLQLVKQSRPELYKQMMSEVLNYKIYGDVLGDPDYADNPAYKNEDGSLNHEKIKEEAVTKLLAEYLINGLEATNESAKRIQTAKNLFQAFIQWIKDKFTQYKNPFKEVLDEINKDATAFGEYADISSEEVFLSAKPLNQVDAENAKNKSIWEKIKKQAGELGVRKIGNEYFDKNGNKVPESKRVSDIKKKHYERLFGKSNFDPAMEAYYKQVAEDGTLIHAYLEDIINAYVDPKTGLIRTTPNEFESERNSPVEKKIFDKLHKYVKGMLAQYEQGTRIITEQVVYDEKKDIYGTIDFIAVSPDGKVDILDWKSTIFKEMEDVKDYKKEGYFIQLNEYKRILKEAYGVEGFGKIRAIPISQHHTKPENGEKRKLSDISVGDSDPSKITKEEKRYRPIISPEEKTGVETIDDLISKLEGYYKKYINKGYYKTNRDLLDDIQEAIYEIRTSNTVDNLTEYLTDLVIKFGRSIDNVKDIDKLSKEDISEILASIQLFRETAQDLFDTAFAVSQEDFIDKNSRARLIHVAERMSSFRIKGDKLEEKLLDKQAKDQNIFNLLLPEKVVNWFGRVFRSMGSQEIASLRLMYELVKKAYNKINISLDADIKKMKDLKYNYDQWRKKNNLSEKDAIAKLVNFERGSLHSKIDKAFYEERKRVFESKDAKEIKKFVTENYDMEAWAADYKAKLKENIELWGRRDFESEDEKTAYIKYKTMEFSKKYNIKAHPLTAFGDHNKLVWSRGIKESNWYSKEYQEIQKVPELKEMYEFFVTKNKELAETGAIEEWEIYSFFPSVRKSLADIVTLEDKNLIQKSGNALYNIYDDFRQSMTVSDYELNFQGAVSETGEKLDKRYIPFVSKLKPEERSFDIFKVYGLMSKEIHKEKYMQENDTILRSLAYFEKNKKVIQQNKYSVLNKKGDKYVVSEERGLNFRAFEPHYKAIVLGETLQIEGDIVLKAKAREKWNKSPLGKLYQFDIKEDTYNPTAISATKFLFWLNTTNSKRILGLNAGSVISNLFGGTYSTNRLFERYTSKEDINKGWAKLSSGAFWASEEMKKNAALADYFLPLLDNNERMKINQLSVSEASKLLSSEWLMAPMRKTSELVQLNIFFGVIENTGLIDGRIVNLRELAAEQTGYYERFSKTPQERTKVEKEFNAKIKELKEKHGLVKHAQFKTIKEGGKDKVIIDIPGVDRNSEDVEKLREIVRTIAKDALGEADEFDTMGYKYSLWGRLMMTFKNWIPKTVDVRFGEFRYSQSHHAYEYGRFRMFARAISANYVHTLLRILPFSGKFLSKEALISKAREVYLEKVAEAKSLGLYNEETFIREGEFVERFIKGVEATYVDFRVALTLFAFVAMGIAAPDDDDDKETKAYKALLTRQIEKLMDEVSFFYNPKSGVDLLGNSAPIVSIIKDSFKLLDDTTQQFFGFTLQNIGFEDKGEEWQEEAKPVKRLFKVIPVFKEILTYMPALDPELAKEWGIRVTNRNGF